MRIDVLTIFPELFTGFLSTSIPANAIEAGALSCHTHDIRAYTDNRHRKVDDRPFGGGPGMVMMCQPIYDAVKAVESMDPTPAVRVLLTPQGEPLAQPRVEWLASQPRLVLLCGHYEGIDERVVEELDPLEISIGDFVLSGGELGAMVLVDAVARLQPGVLGHADSAAEDSFSVRDERGAHLLDCPHYTRPREWRGREVPEVLLSGDHEAVARWRHERRVSRTESRRPDLLAPTEGTGDTNTTNTKRPLRAADEDKAATHVANATRTPGASASDLHGPTAPEGA